MMRATLHASATMYRRSLRELVALGPQTLVAPLIVPAFVLLVYSGLFSDVFVRLHFHAHGVPGFGPRAAYVQYLVAAPLVMSALLATASAGIGVAVERQLGFYDRLELSPLGPVMSQIGRRLGDGTRIALFVVLLTLLGCVAGAHISNWLLALGVAIPLAAMLGMAYGGLAYSLCLRTGSAEAAQAVTPLCLPVLFMSTAFVPIALVPPWLHQIVELNPLSAVCDTIRLAYAGQVSMTALLKSLVAIAALGAVTQTLIIRAERRVRLR
jgi:ABC-2 type transport system permease protein